jgi:hypothetical protein
MDAAKAQSAVRLSVRATYRFLATFWFGSDFPRGPHTAWARNIAREAARPPFVWPTFPRENPSTRRTEKKVILLAGSPEQSSRWRHRRSEKKQVKSTVQNKENITGNTQILDVFGVVPRLFGKIHRSMFGCSNLGRKKGSDPT